MKRLTCSRCKKRKSEDQFFRRATAVNGRRSSCKECDRAYNRKHHQTYKAKRKAYYDDQGRERHRLKKYGVTPERFAEILADQESACAICKTPFEQEICIDHCHQTGKVRGLLCRRCNAGIGHLDDDVERVRAALRYLEV